jgi:hypothetical protein
MSSTWPPSAQADTVPPSRPSTIASPNHAARRRSGLAVHGARAAGESAPDVAEFRQGLAQVGYVENQTVAIEYRWAENRYERLPALAADLVGVTALAVKAVADDLSA